MPNANDKRILYAAESLFAGPSPATGAQPTAGILQLHRVQSCGYDFTRKLTNVLEFGTFAPIDRIELELPTISINSTFLATNVFNEQALGLYVSGDATAIKNILDTSINSQREKNYYLRVVPDGNSAQGYTGIDGGVVAFGNGVLSSYQAQGSVGNFPTAQFTVQALDASWTATSSGFDSPAINPQNGLALTGFSVTLPTPSTGITTALTGYSSGTSGVALFGPVNQITALRPGDITVNLAGAGFGVNNLCIQSYSVQFDLNLDPIICLGSKYPTSREINFPVDCKMSVQANMRDMGTGRLNSLQCGGQKYDLSVTLRQTTCDGSLGPVKAVYTLKQAQLDGQTFNSTIGPSKSVTLNFSAPVGGPQDTGVGLFISGSLY